MKSVLPCPPRSHTSFCFLRHIFPPAFTGGDSLWIAEELPGATFGVAVTAFIFGVVDAILVLVFSRQAGDGPLLQCVSSCIAANQRGHPATAGQNPPSQGAVVAQHQIVLVPPHTTHDSQADGQHLPPPYEPAAAGNAYTSGPYNAQK